MKKTYNNSYYFLHTIQTYLKMIMQSSMIFIKEKERMIELACRFVSFHLLLLVANPGEPRGIILADQQRNTARENHVPLPSLDYVRG